MKLATTTGDFEFFCSDDAERIRELARAGFRYIDLNMYSFTPDSPYMRDDWKKEVQNQVQSHLMDCILEMKQTIIASHILIHKIKRWLLLVKQLLGRRHLIIV